MQLICPHCQAVLEYSEKRPLFCAFCGESLGGSRPGTAVLADSEAVTAPPPPRSTPPTTDAEAATLAPPSAPAPVEEGDPERIGGYRLLRPLGGGGMGTVYEAEEETTGRRVALKLIARSYAGARETVERFRQEGRLASALVHPRCVFVYAADEEAGRPYIVMELMPGSTLQNLVEDGGPLPVTDAVKKIMNVIEGLQEAHALGMVHRDVKPSNCFLDADGHVKVGDFGLAKALVGGAHLTRTGSFLGTPLYASPEQIRGDPVTPQSDLYSVAATLYFLLTGKAPFQSGDAAATLARIVTDDPPSMRKLRPDIPEALDAVVLRGLARHRERRYKDLEEFRQALRPFLPGRSTIVGLGIRFGAYLIDWLCLFLLTQLVTQVVLVPVSARRLSPDRLAVNEQLALGACVLISRLLLEMLYFLPEGIWGCSIGKAALRLRVCRVLDTDPPGLWRAVVRTLVFELLPFSGQIVGMVIWFTYPFPAHPEERPEEMLKLASVLTVVATLQFVGGVVGYGLILGTMRQRNGFRGLHEFLSGTRVVQLPQKERRLHVRGRTVQDQLVRPPELPARVGPFAVKGALRTGGQTGVLLGEDKGLNRDVLIWLRPAAAPALDTARRGLSRITRLRWLGSGRHGDQQWDAFLAPSGCSLPALIEARGPLAWPDARPLLEQLTDELVHACDDRTLPWRLRVEQLWVQASGRVLLLDMPVSEETRSPGDTSVTGPRPPGPPGDSEEVVSLHEQEQRQALSLLRQAAGLMLRGQADPPGGFLGGRGAPPPEHATALLRRLASPGANRYVDLAQFRTELVATRLLPREVTRPRRAAQLATLLGFLFVSCGCLLPFSVIIAPSALWSAGQQARAEGQRHLDDFDAVVRRDLLLAELNPALPARLAGLGMYSADLRERDRFTRIQERERQRAQALLEALPQQTQASFQAQQRQQEALGKALKRPHNPWAGPADARARLRDSGEADKYYLGVYWGTAIATAVPPVLWVLWAFVMRGGFTFPIVGLSLVRRDGRPAARWQCAWRALLVWLPITAAVTGSLYLLGRYWATWRPEHSDPWLQWAGSALWWAGVGLMLVDVALALWRPSRTVHDWLAGTYVVPK
jgi:eukaryotic-like serine/threonine-protein kinase